MRLWRNWYSALSLLIISGIFINYHAVTPVAGSGNCLSFNGTNQYVNIGLGAVLTGPPYTIEFWIKCNTPSDSARIFQQGNGTGVGFQLTAYWYKNRIEFAYTPSASGRADVASGIIPNGVWVHVAETWDGIDSAKFPVYVNGRLDTAAPSTTGKSVTGGIFIGSSNGSNYFKGNIDEVRVWRVVRTQAQIQNNMYTHVSGSDPNLAGYWCMDTSSGTLVRDFAPIPHAGTCVNMTNTNWVASEAWTYRFTRGTTAISHGAGYDPAGDAITVTQSLLPVKGVLSINGTNLTYTPNANSGGVDSYVFRVSDGSLNDTFRVTVTDTNAPYILVQPVKNQTVAVNQPVSFSVKATGFPFPTFQWRKLVGTTWTNINTATTGDSIYTIASAKDTSAGAYRVVVTNTLGSVTSDTAYLTVQTPPVITIQPQKSQTLTEGSLFRVWVAATGKPRPGYQWQKLAGTTWNTITGATDSIFKIDTTKLSDTGVYRVAVSNPVATVYSDSAKLIIAIKPVITSIFPYDTVLIANASLSLTATATGIPQPTFEWYFKRTPTEVPQLITGTAVMSIDTVKKANNGYYFVVAKNSAGVDSSRIVFVHVLDPVRITTDLPPRYGVPLAGTAILRIQTTGDDYISYRWYANDTLLPNDTLNTLTLKSVTSGMSGKTYQCRVSNSFMNTLLGSDTSRVCTLTISKYYNPFLARADKVTQRRLLVNIWSQDPDIKNFQTEDAPLTPKPWSDSLWLMYQRSVFVADPAKEGIVKLLSTAAIKAVCPDTTRIFIDVDSLILPDSFYCVNYTLKWHAPGASDTLFHPFYEAGKILMLDTSIANNPLQVKGVYVPGTDSALLIVDSIQKLIGSKDSFVTIQCNTDPTFLNQNTLVFNQDIAAAALLATQQNSDTLVIHNLAPLPIETDTVYCRWSVTRKNLVKSMQKKSDFIIGWERPVFTGVFDADSTTNSTQLKVSWNGQIPAVDSVRIWYDGSKVLKAGDLNIPLPLSQAMYAPPYAISDTVTGLSSYKKYYCWIQIYRDQMWSRICTNGSDSAYTAHPDTQQIQNLIGIDSVWFNDTTNRVMVRWNIDTTLLPGGKQYECGYTYSLDTTGFLNANQIWSVVHQGTNITEVDFGKAIWFDTVYTIGLWLRGRDLITGKVTQAAPPTDTSTCKGRVPSFTWQILALALVPCPDTQYVANRRIIFRTLAGKPFDFVDTIRSYRRDTVPAGFLKADGVPFKFTKKNPEINDFMLGLRYGSLPLWIPRTSLRLYRDIQGTVCVVYGSYEENGVVWAQVRKTDLGYPFMVLADTMKPVILPAVYSDTVDSGAAQVVTSFKLKENAGNACYEFAYGAGDKGYSYVKKDTLKPGKDSTITGIANNVGTEVASASFGLRARLIVSDGVAADTEDVSRQVRSKQGEAYPVNPLQWAPLRVTLDLDNNGSIDSVFNRSMGEDNRTWQYDKTKQRVFRYFRPGIKDTNDWTEYSDDLKGYFAFKPGRVIWLKSAKDLQVYFGGGLTQSLKKPYTIDLKPKTWTDFSLPYQFYVMLRDVLETTGTTVSRKLEVYRWVWKESEKIYNPEPKFIGMLNSDLTKVKDTLKNDQPNNAYIVFNHDTGIVSLQIPPICLPLSKYAGGRKAFITEKDKGEWVLSLLWRKDQAGCAYSTVFMGYNPQLGVHSFYGPLPPSMGLVRAGIVDMSSGTVCGYGIHGSCEEGGVLYVVDFTNKAEEGTTLAYTLEGMQRLPAGFSARILNLETMRYEETGDGYSLFAAAGSSVKRAMVVGNEGYFDKALKQLTPWNLQFVRAYPNPFKGYIKLLYTLPDGIREVGFTLYDMRGRALWRGMESKQTVKGSHVFVLDDRSGNFLRRTLSSGTYIIRMSAKNSAGKVLYGGQRKITCMQ